MIEIKSIVERNQKREFSNTNIGTNDKDFSDLRKFDSGGTINIIVTPKTDKKNKIAIIVILIVSSVIFLIFWSWNKKTKS